MAISKIVKAFNAKRTNGTFVFVNVNNVRQDLTSEADTESAADAALEAQIVTKRDAAQGNVDELNEVLTLAST
jgi:hypothetical protein